MKILSQGNCSATLIALSRCMHATPTFKTQGYVCFSVDSQLSRASQAQSSSLLDHIGNLGSQTEDYQKGTSE